MTIIDCSARPFKRLVFTIEVLVYFLNGVVADDIFIISRSEGNAITKGLGEDFVWSPQGENEATKNCS